MGVRDEVGVAIRGAEVLQRGEVIASRHQVEAPWRDHPLGPLYVCRDVRARPEVDAAQAPRVLVQRLRREFDNPRARSRIASLHEAVEVPGRTAEIPEVVDAGVDFDGRPYWVTPMLRGKTLAEIEPPLAFADVVTLAEQIADALAPEHAHRRVHGGLEPASVVVDWSGGLPKLVALLGFGLVPTLADAGGKQRKIPLLMTPTHVAPEVVRGEAIGPAADVYALGVLVWELLFGVPPFRGPTLRVLDAHLHRALPERELPFDVPPAFDWVLRRMLAKNPVDRFPDAGSVAAHLRPFALDAVPDLSFEIEHELSGPLTAAAPQSPAAAPEELPDDVPAAHEDEATCVYVRAAEDDGPGAAEVLVDDDAPRQRRRPGLAPADAPNSGAADWNLIREVSAAVPAAPPAAKTFALVTLALVLILLALAI